MIKHTTFKSALLLTAATLTAATLIAAGSASAQTPSGPLAQTDNSAEAQSSAQDTTEVIVTGRAGGVKQRKLEASFAISTLSENAIARYAPRSTADLLKAVPGVWVESSGGVSGANVNLRGFPGTGDAPFLTVQLNGVPIFTPPTLSFLENSTVFRVDETIDHLEALRGGPNPILSNGQTGLTTNFILKEGGDETKGDVRFTTSDYGLLQVDSVMSGKLADNLYYMIGGYAQTSRGAREADFDTEKGYQFTANITRVFDNGKVNVYYRRTNDHGAWYQPTPLNAPGVDNDYVQVSSANRKIAVEGPYGKTLNADYGDGRGFDGFVAGGTAQFDLDDGWKFTDRFIYLKGDADTYGLGPRGGARKLSDLGLTSAQTMITHTTLGAGDVVQHIGFTAVQKDIYSLTNDLTVSRGLGTGSVSLGYFVSHFGSDDLWNINNNARYFQVGGTKEQVAINCATITNAPSACLGGTRVDADGDGSMNAVYITADQKLFDALTIDGGLRWVDQRLNYVGEVGGDPVTGLTGVPNINSHYDHDGVAWTVGANYALSRNMGVFLRVNDGFRVPYFDDIRGGQTQLAAGDDLFFKVRQREAGFKMQQGGLGIYLTAFDVFTQSTRSTSPVVGAPVQRFETKSKGLELDATYSMHNGFAVTAAATYLDGEISADSDPANVGHQAPRQPKLQARLSPSYGFRIGNLTGSIYGAYSYVGKRQSNIQNTQPLPSYEKFDLGLELQTDSGLSLRIAGDNLTNSQGLTEGDPNTFGLNANGRYILPRSVRVSVGYEF